MDTRTPEQRSRIMSAVGVRNTSAELQARAILKRLRYRFTTQGMSLAGRPDIVFRKRKKVIFIHGCFWHGHRCRKGRLPKSRLGYWRPKIDANKRRDRRNIAHLRSTGWSVLIVWQCQLRNAKAVAERMKAFLRSSHNPNVFRECSSPK